MNVIREPRLTWFDRRQDEFREPIPPGPHSRRPVSTSTCSVTSTEEDADRVAVVDAKSGAETTYRDLLARIDAFAGALAAAASASATSSGCTPRTVPAFAIAFHGILRAGATATTINALFTAKDIAKQLTDSQADVLVTVSPLLPQAAEGAAEIGLPDEQVDRARRPARAADGHPNAADLLGPALPPPEVTFDPATHLAVLPYSSGTTGNPKGVMLTHRNLVANVAQIRPLQGMGADDRILAVLPFFHIYGMTVLLNAALHARARLVIMPRFDLAEFLGNIQKHRCTYVFIAPPMAVALAKHPLVERYDLSSLRGIMSGAAPLDEDSGSGVGRGSAAGGPGLRDERTEPRQPRHAVRRRPGDVGSTAPLSSCGWTVANAVSKIVDPETGAEIDAPASGLSDAGELWFKGPNVMVGYLGNERGHRGHHRRRRVPAHRRHRARRLRRCVYIVDRLKELIKYKGYQVPPAELEAVLLTHPQIADAAVIGVPDAESGEEIPKAFVVKQSGAELTAAR